MITQLTITTLLAAAIMGSGSIAYSQGYDRSILTKIEHKYTIGFERQVYTLYNNNRVGISNKTKTAEEYTNRILFRMKVTTRLRLETGLSFRDINKILSNNGKQAKTITFNSPLINSIPLTIQYQLQNERKRLRPYIGTGVQFYNGNSSPNTAIVNDEMGISNGLKYINIIFTQGLIYDITPDLQISQSIHIIPDNGIRPIGINIGVGYRIK
jgi:hypothetical protein